MLLPSPFVSHLDILHTHVFCSAQYTKDGVFIKEYKSIAEAGRTSTVKKVILDLYYLEELKWLVDLYGNTRKTFSECS